MKHIRDKVIMVYVEFPQSNVEQDVYELKELLATAQCEIVLEISQKRNSVDPVTVLGSGKIDELENAIRALDCEVDAIIFSCPVNSTQRAALSKQLQCSILDKIDLILDIFALRAKSAEGKKQVELAQLSYNITTKPEGDFSRQGAGIGTRGPGETKLETNKRLIRNRIVKLKQDLKEIEVRRALTRKRRQENKVFTIALVGYTNAGKSTLFNKLTDSSAYADDKLFATLDTTTRKITLDNGVEAVVCDTVGFIKELPHALINAFKSTLEETVNADLILNICDISDENVAAHINVTENILGELGADSTIIRVYNKCDKVSLYNVDYQNNISFVYVSALTGKNIDALKEMITKRVMETYAKIKLKINYADSQVISQINKYSDQCKIEYKDEYVLISATLPRKYVNLFARYLDLT